MRVELSVAAFPSAAVKFAAERRLPRLLSQLLATGFPSVVAELEVDQRSVIPGKWGSVDPCGEPSKSRGFQGGQRRRAILESWCYTRRNGAASI